MAMWIVVIGGAFSVVTLLVKAAIDLGSKTSRARRAITADLELLEKLSSAMPDASGSYDLRERIDRHLVEYALSDLAPSPVPSSEVAERVDDPRVRGAWVRLGSLAIAVAASTLGSAVIAWLSDGVGSLDSKTFSAFAPALAAIVGITVSILSVSVLRRQSRMTLEESRLYRRELQED